MTAIRIVPQEKLPVSEGKQKKGKRQKRKEETKKKWGIRITALVAVILLILFGAYKYSFGGKQEKEINGTLVGAGVKVGAMEEDGGDDETGAGSNGKSDMTVRLNGFPVFADGRSEGNLNIVNPAANLLSMNVEIVLDDTGEVIYQSGAIPPDHYIDNDKLTKVLEKGQYNATAHVTLIDPEYPDASFNSANFKLMITIES